MRVIDYKDGIKGEAAGLLLMCENKYCLIRHYEYKQLDHITRDFSYLIGTDLMDTVTHFPELFYKESLSAISGLVDSMLYLGDMYNYLPKTIECLYNSLRLIRVCDRLESLLSFMLAAKHRDSDVVLNEIQFLTASIIADTEALLQDDSQLYLLEGRCTILDFVILGLYVACCDQDELRELVAYRTEQSPRLGAYLQRRVQHLLPVLIRYGHHVVCHATGPYATVYWLLMSQARLPFKIVPSPQPYLQILNRKFMDMDVVLKSIASLLGFDTRDQSPLLTAALELWTTIPALWESTKREQLEIVEKYFCALGMKGLHYNDKARLDELYCMRLKRDLDPEISSRLLPALSQYVTKWLCQFTRKENCLLLVSNIKSACTFVDLESVVYLSTFYPFTLLESLHNIGYNAEVLILGLDNYKERIARIKERPDYREGRLDILNACDGSELDGCSGMSTYKVLDELKITYAGCTYESLFNSTYKEVMKAIYTQAGVPTAPFVVMSHWDPTITTEHIPYPVLIKPSAGFASIGLTNDAKCNNVAELEARMKERGKKALFDNKFVVESFVQGREYTILVVGSAATDVIAYEPIERVFDKRKAPEDRWLSYTEEWFNPYSYKWKKVTEPELAERLKDISKKAHLALAGAGYSRTDFREDHKTGKLYLQSRSHHP